MSVAPMPLSQPAKPLFAKMNGLGNKIIVADLRGSDALITPEAARALAADPVMNFDQIMAIHDRKNADSDYYIRIINCDGSEAQACGNGTRCVVQALARESGKTRFTFETLAGLLEAEELANGQIRVDMGRPRFDWQQIPLASAVADTSKIALQAGSQVGSQIGSQAHSPMEPVLQGPSVASMGNPHAIFWVERDVWSYALELYGPELEHAPIFPQKANISIAQLSATDELTIRTWERGVGLTRACGSAACAAAVSAARTGRTGRKVKVIVPGGTLLIEWRDDDHVLMTGPAEWEFSGRFDPVSGAWQPETELGNPSQPVAGLDNSSQPQAGRDTNTEGA